MYCCVWGHVPQGMANFTGATPLSAALVNPGLVQSNQQAVMQARQLAASLAVVSRARGWVVAVAVSRVGGGGELGWLVVVAAAAVSRFDS